MKSVRIIYVVDDGITTLRCGVGAIAMNFVSAFPAIVKKMRRENIIVSLSVISIAPTPHSIGRRNDLYSRTRFLCHSLGGEVYLLPLSPQIERCYFNFSLWRKLNRMAGNLIDTIVAQSTDEMIVLANDSIFSHIRPHNRKVRLVWIPHSLMIIHAQSYIDQNARRMWEKDALAFHQQRPNSFIGYVSLFVKRILHEHMGVPVEKLISFHNGFCIPTWRQEHRHSKTQILNVLNSRRIPLTKPLLLTYARADEYKGLDTALRVMIALTKKHRYHGVLIASRFSNEEIVRRVQNHLSSLWRKHSNSINLFLDYEFELPKYLLNYPGTKFLLHLPSRDFCPLVPFEAELIGHEDLCIINSNINCFEGLIKNREDGFLISPTGQASVRDAEAIVSLPEHTRKVVLKKGRERTYRLFNLEQNYTHGIQTVLGEQISAP